ncbi:MAG: hypothetical protein SF162_10420 [bacterium]|nr:hypothetical protein [bacterium]
MDTAARSKTEALKEQIQRKIQTVLAEFADGTLSREQFHAIYAHYSDQLSMIEAALNTGNDAEGIGKPNETIAIRASFMGKAIGLVIYHHKSGMFVETLGQFDVPPSRIAPTLNDFSLMTDAGKLIDRRIEKIGMKQWLLFAPGKYTTIVTLFQNEPSPHQSRELERLHHDFEVANGALLTAGRVDSSKLAYPFVVFVQQKLKRP